MNAVTPQKNLVLVVDDSPDTLSLLNDVLEAQGITTLVALEGSQALRIAHRIVPDLILLDAVMPQLDGFQTCIQLKATPELRNVPVIFMTGSTDTTSVIKAFQAGGVDYVTKPVNPLELLARIRVHLANAKIMLSAQSALDSAGQNICAINSDAELMWATPQAVRALEVRGVAEWLPAAARSAIRRWLSHCPVEGGHVEMEIHNEIIKFQLLRQNPTGEILLQLQCHAELDEIAALRHRYPLTQREAEVLVWLAQGKTNREIGQILELSPRTVNKHLEQIFKKVGVENRTTAAAQVVSLLRKVRS